MIATLRFLPAACLAGLVLTFAPAVFADPAGPETAETSDLPAANAIDEAAVRKLLGQKAVITGRVTSAFESPKGLTFLDLEGGRFTIVCYKADYAKFEGGSPAKLYAKKTISVTGEVFEYKKGGDQGKLEIKLQSPEQMKIVPAEKDEAAEKKPAKEKPSSRKKTTPADDKKKTSESGTAEAPDDPAPGKKPTARTSGRVDPKKYFDM